MKYFANVNNENIVETVNVINDADLDDTDYPESESLGQAYLSQIGIKGNWLECSTDNSFRGAYPGAGSIYDPKNDIFVNPITTNLIEGLSNE